MCVNIQKPDKQSLQLYNFNLLLRAFFFSKTVRYLVQKIYGRDHRRPGFIVILSGSVHYFSLDHHNKYFRITGDCKWILKMLKNNLDLYSHSTKMFRNRKVLVLNLAWKKTKRNTWTNRITPIRSSTQLSLLTTYISATHFYMIKYT